MVSRDASGLSAAIYPRGRGQAIWPEPILTAPVPVTVIDGPVEDVPAPSNVLLPYLGLHVYILMSMMRPQDWWGPMLGMPVDYIVFALIFMTAAMSPDGLNRLRLVFTSQQTWLIAGYMGAAIASLVLNGIIGEIFSRVMLLAQLFVVYVIFAAFSAGAHRARRLLMLVVTVGAVLAYQGMQQMETGIGWAGQSLYWGGRIRWIGMYDGANVLCMLFVIAIACALHFIVGPWSLATRVYCALATVSLVYGVYLTNSRGGFLALVLVVMATVILKRTDKPLHLRFSRVIIASFAAVIILGVGPSRLESLNDNDSSASGRIDAWQEGLEMFKANPLVGIGDGQWRTHHWRLAHNSIVQTMGEIGMVGLVAWLAMLFGCARMLLRVRVPNRSPRDRSMATALLVALCGFTACSYFVTTVQFDLTYIFCGMAFSLCGDREREEAQLNLNHLVLIVAAATMLIAMLYVTVRVFYATV